MIVRTTTAAILAIGLTATACASMAVALSQPATGPASQPASAAAAPVPSEPWEARPLSWLQGLSWLAAVAAAFYAIYTGQQQSALNREQRAEELNWKRTQAAQTLNEEMMNNESARAAMLMIDYPHGRPYILPGGSGSATITQADVISALQGNFAPAPVPPLDRYIRDCFDEFLYRVGILEHYVSRELVAFKDVKHPTDYYVNRMITVGLRDPVKKYAALYGFDRTQAFFAKFEKW